MGREPGFRVKDLSLPKPFPSPAHLQAAYLALTQFLDQNNELVLLLVNTLLSELKSDNYIAGGGQGGREGGGGEVGKVEEGAGLWLR